MGEDSHLSSDLTITAEVGDNVHNAAIGAHITQNIGYTPAQFAEMVARILDLIQTAPQLRSRLPGARSLLFNTRNQIRLLAEYKTVHDLLQRLESSYVILYHLVYDNGQLLPIVQVRWAALSSSCRSLRKAVDTVCRTIENVSFTKDLGYDLQILSQAGLTLQQAYDERDLALLDAALEDIASIINTQTSRMNHELIGAARALRLEELVQTLWGIHSELTQSTPNLDILLQQKLDEFAKDVAGVNDLQIQLVALRDDHNYWQAIDDELRLVRSKLLLSVRRFQQDWRQRIKPRIELLYRDIADEWAQLLAQQVHGLELTFIEENVTPMIVAFDECRDSVNMRFNQVDYNFYRLCNTLKEADGPLDVLLERLP